MLISEAKVRASVEWAAAEERRAEQVHWVVAAGQPYQAERFPGRQVVAAGQACQAEQSPDRPVVEEASALPAGRPEATLEKSRVEAVAAEGWWEADCAHRDHSS
jgi:hypothetical protein